MNSFERQQLSGISFCFPVYGQRRDPLEFYVGSDSGLEDPCAHFEPPVVTLPVLSIKFFDDLSVAHAWLWRHEYSPETALEYAAMLKYGDKDQFGERYPEPLKALRIPQDALDDPVVEAQAQKLLKSAIIFLTLHELGHVLHRHGGYDRVSAVTAQSNEREADEFALEMMRRIGVVPYGMVFWFQTAAYLSSNRPHTSGEGRGRRA